MKQRKTFSKEFKARVVLDAIKGQKTISELATEYGVHPNQIGQWKKTLLKDSAELFARSKDRDIETHEAEKERLYQQIGKLQDMTGLVNFMNRVHLNFEIFCP